MNIKRISVYQVDLPLVEERYTWADGKFVETFDSTIVEIETHNGLCGLGEVCPLGPFYLPAFGAGARTGIGELAQHLINQPATHIGRIQSIMDQALLGHPYAKSAIDWRVGICSAKKRANRSGLCLGESSAIRSHFIEQ